MNSANPTFGMTGNVPVAHIGADARGRFIARTYSHLLGAIAAFVALEALIFMSGAANAVVGLLTAVPWLAVLGVFMVASWLATRLASSSTSVPMQYAGLGILVAAYALIFTLPLAIANTYFPGVIQSSALITLTIFSGLTWYVFMTRKDFSWMGGILACMGVGAIALIVASALFGFQLGMVFMAFMVILSGAAILYDTSNVLHHYPEDRYVAASLQLFASVAMMFWYILQFMMSLSSD